MNNCPKCNAEVSEVHVFCPFCGEELKSNAAKERICSNCNSVVESEHSFCPFCGTKAESDFADKKVSPKNESFCVCPNCLASVDASYDNCPLCNTSLTSTNFSATADTDTNRKGPKQEPGLHCPTCKSKKITPLNEVNIDGGMTLNHGKYSSLLMSTSNKTVWVCSECGTKFRNIPGLQEDLQKEINTLNFFKISFFLILAGIIFLTFLTFAFDLWILSPIIVLSILADVFMVVLWIVFNNRVNKLETELDYLQTECFY